MLKMTLLLGDSTADGASEAVDHAADLQSDLAQVESVDSVTHPPSEAPDGSKGTALEWASLVVTASGAIPPLVSALRGWLVRRPSATLRIVIDEDVLELPSPTDEQQEGLIEAFLERHR